MRHLEEAQPIRFQLSFDLDIKQPIIKQMKALAKIPLPSIRDAVLSPGALKARLEAIAIALVLAFSTLLYLLTLYSGIGGRINYGDSVKWQFLWAIDGTPHSTGYPLFLMITKLFGELLTFVEPYYRISAVSLVFGVFALVPVYLITKEITSVIYLRVASPLLLALSSTYWSQSTEPEVYTLSVFLLTLCIWLLMRFVRGGSIGFLFASLVVYAASFGNHLTASMLVPAYIYAILSSSRRRQALKAILIMLPLLVLLSIGQYAYIYYLSHKGSAYLGYIGKNASIWKLLDYSTGGQFRDILGSSLKSPKVLAAQVAKFLYIFHRDLRLPLFLVAIYSIWSNLVFSLNGISAVGMGALWRHQVSDVGALRKAKTVLLLAILFQSMYALSYPISDIQTYYLSIYSFLIPLSMSSVGDFVVSTSLGSRKLIRNIVICALLGTLAVQFVYGFRENKPRDNTIESTVKEIFNMIPESSSLYVDPREDYHLYEAFWYYSVLGMPEKDVKIEKNEVKGYLVRKNGESYLLESVIESDSAVIGVLGGGK